MRIISIGFVSIWLGCLPSVLLAAVYEWVDDKGVIHFTDNADKIPPKYLGRAKEKATGSSRVTIIPPSPSGEVAPVAPGQPLNGVEERGRWAARLARLQSEKKVIEDGLVAKKEKLNSLRRKKTIYQRGTDRVAYEKQQDEIARDEAIIKELEQRIEQLTADAARVGVTFDSPSPPRGD